MTPKEKAKELVDKYLDVKWVMTTDKDFSTYLEVIYKNDIYTAKQCALIASDEIINELEGTNSTKEGGFFWQEVKQEIEKL